VKVQSERGFFGEGEGATFRARKQGMGFRGQRGEIKGKGLLREAVEFIGKWSAGLLKESEEEGMGFFSAVAAKSQWLKGFQGNEEVVDGGGRRLGRRDGFHKGKAV